MEQLTGWLPALHTHSYPIPPSQPPKKGDWATVIDVLKQEFEFKMTHVVAAFSEIKYSVSDMAILPKGGIS